MKYMNYDHAMAQPKLDIRHLRLVEEVAATPQHHARGATPAPDAIRAQPPVARRGRKIKHATFSKSESKDGAHAGRRKASGIRSAYIDRPEEHGGPDSRRCRSRPRASAYDGMIHVLSLASAGARSVPENISQCGRAHRTRRHVKAVFVFAGRKA